MTRGSGPDVVLIPGLAASRGVWTSTAAAVPGYRYHFVQVAGFAGTPAGGNRTGPIAASVAAEIARYIAAHRLNRPAIVGHSMGGSIAMMIGARHPKAVGKVMVVDMLPSPGTAVRTARVGDEAAGEADRRRAARAPTGFGASSSRWSCRASAVPTGWKAGTIPTVVGRSVEELLSTDLTPELPRIRAPLTVVYACSGIRFACGQVSRAFTSRLCGRAPAPAWSGSTEAATRSCRTSPPPSRRRCAASSPRPDE